MPFEEERPGPTLALVPPAQSVSPAPELSDDRPSTPPPDQTRDSFVTASQSSPTSSPPELTRRPGWDWVPCDAPAPKQISSAIDPANIISGKRRVHMANVKDDKPIIAMVALSPLDPLDEVPCTYRNYR
ncbi:hypothetical protein VP01_3563g2 [Puccinia sorghi]|uniref:Uncharacterized protein n=1 Tax=Puccinia sorghi TaxID=27349 RepID=A0A0L6UVB2_9BASI|nr:hypothetical protein VP01_3563g2 [Puccinia sorghi]